ncbi:MAG TPA: TolC family protein, partial [Gemmatimonadaceae bacterium]|nr:TolC family protein [Gemmatimonadaceae bacterium]
MTRLQWCACVMIPYAALVPSGAVAAQAAMAVATAPAPQSHTALTLTLDSAVAIAVRGATAVLLARDATRVSGALVLERYGQFLPDLVGNGGFSQFVGNPLLSGAAIIPTKSRFRDLDYQVTTTLNLFNGFADVAGLKAAVATRSAADLTLERVRQTIALDVTQAYLRVVLDSELVSIATQNLAASNQRVVQLQELVRVGKRPPADLYRQQAQAAADLSTLADARNHSQTDVIGLLERLRLDPHQPVTIAPAPPDTTLLAPSYTAVDSLVHDATARRADLKAADERVTASRSSITQARSGYLPQLDLEAGVFSAGRFFDYATVAGRSMLTTPQTPLWDQVGRQTTGVLALGLNWAIFDRFRTRFTVEQARATFDSARYVDQDLRFQVAGDVAQALGDYRTAVEQLTASTSGLVAAQQAYDLVNGRFQVGFASIVDVTTAQSALVQAQALQAQAVLNLGLRKRGVAYALGL